jgi:hypothetical protein
MNSRLIVQFLSHHWIYELYSVLFGKTNIIVFVYVFAVLDVHAFERLLGPCMDILKRNISDYDEQIIAIFGSKSAMSDLR